MAAVVNSDAHWGGADAVLAARRGGGRTKLCAAHPAMGVVPPVAVAVPLATPTDPGQSRCLSSSTRSVSVKDMDNDYDDRGGGLWRNTLPAEMM